MSETVKHTPGPWAWFGNANSNHVYLATTHSGRRYVMDFVRWGMRGAQPRFQPERGGMVDAKDLLQFEVGDQSIVGIEAAKKDGSVYRYDVRGIDCADARLIAASPELLDALKDVVCAFAMNNAEPEELLRALARPIEQASAVIRKAEGGAA
ncbi:hypothetical protein [Sinorhizobium meliloti]|uniref:hypothetical protein n=1 Tax=Rhizobium meliloti TaxID=382 RepID=UPI000FD9215A|nr:hypothetical protein [Sinorhizobium meliloti]RVJ93121.1 hypothetical protein CN169_12975 [Sinorhizobium meliloti]